MQKLYYQFPGTWFGDCMPFGHGDKFYLYHQRDTRKPGPFGEPFGWDLATTSDFVHYEDKGVAIPRGTDEEQDQFIFAGSVLFHHTGMGNNRLSIANYLLKVKGETRINRADRDNGRWSGGRDAHARGSGAGPAGRRSRDRGVRFPRRRRAQ